MIICTEMEQYDFQTSFKITTSAQQTRARPTEVTRLLLYAVLLNNHHTLVTEGGGGALVTQYGKQLLLNLLTLSSNGVAIVKPDWQKHQEKTFHDEVLLTICVSRQTNNPVTIKTERLRRQTFFSDFCYSLETNFNIYTTSLQGAASSPQFTSITDYHFSLSTRIKWRGLLFRQSQQRRE